MNKLTRKTTALIKDLELQIDFLIGYTPQGLHWKQEYYFRKTLLDETLSSENTPPEIREKINHIEETLFHLRNKETYNQGYIKYSENDYKKKKKVLVNEMGGKQSYYIEI